MNKFDDLYKYMVNEALTDTKSVESEEELAGDATTEEPAVTVEDVINDLGLDMVEDLTEDQKRLMAEIALEKEIYTKFKAGEINQMDAIDLLMHLTDEEGGDTDFGDEFGTARPTRGETYKKGIDPEVLKPYGRDIEEYMKSLASNQGEE